MRNRLGIAVGVAAGLALGFLLTRVPAQVGERPGASADDPMPARDGWTRPPALKTGDTIAFVAPAGSADPDKVRAARERFERMGFRVSVPATLTERKDRYLAGSDDD